MHSLPVDFDLASLKNNVLVEICFSANQIRFVFDGRVVITLEGDCILAASGPENAVAHISAPSPHSGLFALIQLELVNATVDSTRKNLALEFSTGEILTLIGDQPYECYHIKLADKEFIV